MEKLENLIGSRHGKLIVIEDLGMQLRTGKRKQHYCKFKCDCGRIIETSIVSARTGNSTSCGNCSGASRKYGNKLYICFMDMIGRCCNSKFKNYKNYGGRGITICEEWLNPITGFENFRKWSLSNGFDNKKSIDRINNDGNYEPSNCRWANRRIQNINKRPSAPNTSGFIGVRKHSSGIGWYGSVKIGNKDYYTGYSKNIIEAVKMRNEYIIKHNLENKLNEVV